MLRDPEQEKLLKPKSLKRSKYGNKRVKLDGQWFDSIAEASRFVALKECVALGEIEQLQCQYRFKFRSGVVYKADFTYRRKGEFVVEDVKSISTCQSSVYRIKKRLLKDEYGLDINEIFLDPVKARAIVSAYAGRASQPKLQTDADRGAEDSRSGR